MPPGSTMFTDPVSRGVIRATVLPRNWVVERTFAWLGRCPRLPKDCEKTIASAETSQSPASACSHGSSQDTDIDAVFLALASYNWNFEWKFAPAPVVIQTIDRHGPDVPVVVLQFHKEMEQLIFCFSVWRLVRRSSLGARDARV